MNNLSRKELESILLQDIKNARFNKEQLLSLIGSVRTMNVTNEGIKISYDEFHALRVGQPIEKIVKEHFTYIGAILLEAMEKNDLETVKLLIPYISQSIKNKLLEFAIIKYKNNIKCGAIIAPRSIADYIFQNGGYIPHNTIHNLIHDAFDPEDPVEFNEFNDPILMMKYSREEEFRKNNDELMIGSIEMQKYDVVIFLLNHINYSYENLRYFYDEANKAELHSYVNKLVNEDNRIKIIKKLSYELEKKNKLTI